IVEPSRSAGSRSGVNCTRVNLSPNAAAKDLAISVLPRPGRSSMSTWPRARTAVSISVSAERLPTTTRSISSSTASQCAVVVAAGRLIFGWRLQSHLLQPSQNLLQCGTAGTGLAVTGTRDVVRINPFPQFGAKEHSAACVICRGVFRLPLARGHFVSAREHRTQVAVPIRSGGIRPPDRRLGGGKPAAQGIPQIVGIQFRRRFRSASQETTDVEQHKSQGGARGSQYESAVMQYQSQQLYHDDEANTQDDKLFHTGLRNSARTSRSTFTAILRCPSFITCGEKRASSNRFTSCTALSACSAWCSTARTRTSVGVSKSWGAAPGTLASSRSIAA